MRSRGFAIAGVDLDRAEPRRAELDLRRHVRPKAVDYVCQGIRRLRCQTFLEAKSFRLRQCEVAVATCPNLQFVEIAGADVERDLDVLARWIGAVRSERDCASSALRGRGSTAMGVRSGVSSSTERSLRVA